MIFTVVVWPCSTQLALLLSLGHDLPTPAVRLWGWCVCVCAHMERYLKANRKDGGSTAADAQEISPEKVFSALKKQQFCRIFM